MSVLPKLPNHLVGAKVSWFTQLPFKQWLNNSRWRHRAEQLNDAALGQVQAVVLRADQSTVSATALAIAYTSTHLETLLAFVSTERHADFFIRDATIDDEMQCFPSHALISCMPATEKGPRLPNTRLGSSAVTCGWHLGPDSSWAHAAHYLNISDPSTVSTCLDKEYYR